MYSKLLASSFISFKPSPFCSRISSSTGALTAGDNVICMTGLNPGELHVDVPQGVTNENYATVLSGNLRLVKEGAGTFVGGKSGQKYGGGTVVAGGTARPRTGVQNSLTYYEAQYFFGGEYSKLTIESGAVFDIAGHFAYRVHDIVLNGGTSSPRTSRSCWTRRAATARNAASP